jgi:hypothetical protein
VEFDESFIINILYEDVFQSILHLLTHPDVKEIAREKDRGSYGKFKDFESYFFCIK